MNEWEKAVRDALAVWTGVEVADDAPASVALATLLQLEREAAGCLHGLGEPLKSAPAEPSEAVMQLLNHIEDVVEDETWERIDVKLWNAVTTKRTPAETPPAAGAIDVRGQEGEIPTDGLGLEWVHSVLRWAAAGYVHTPERMRSLRGAYRVVDRLVNASPPEVPPAAGAALAVADSDVALTAEHYASIASREKESAARTQAAISAEIDLILSDSESMLSDGARRSLNWIALAATPAPNTAGKIKDAFFEGFLSPVTYNDTAHNSPEEAWEASSAKDDALKALQPIEREDGK